MRLQLSLPKSVFLFWVQIEKGAETQAGCFKEEFITLKSLFIDGTKIEANANRYTFVWRGTLNYHLAGLLDTADSVYQKYNTLIDEKEYDIPHAHMFVIEGMEKVTETKTNTT